MDTAYKLETVEERDGKLYRLKMVTFKARSMPPLEFGVEFRPGEGFVGFRSRPEGRRPSPADMVRLILEERGELNASQIKAEANQRFSAGKHAIDRALTEWPSSRKGPKGNTKLYSLGLRAA